MEGNTYQSKIDNLSQLFSSIDLKQYKSLIINGTMISKINEEFIATLIKTSNLMKEKNTEEILKKTIHQSDIKVHRDLLTEFNINHEFYTNKINIKQNEYQFNFEEKTYIKHVIDSINNIPSNNQSIPIIIPIFSNYLISLFENPTISVKEHLKHCITLLKKTYEQIKNISIIIFVTFPQKFEKTKKINTELEYTSFFTELAKYSNADSIYLMNYHTKSNEMLIKQFRQLPLINLLIGEENISPLIHTELVRTIQKNSIKENLINASRRGENPLQSIQKTIENQRKPGIKATKMKDLNNLFIKIILKNTIEKVQSNKKEQKQ